MNFPEYISYGMLILKSTSILKKKIECSTLENVYACISGEMITFYIRPSLKRKVVLWVPHSI
jgi:hypothetical protein